MATKEHAQKRRDTMHSSTTTHTFRQNDEKIFRPRADRVLCGVCAGLARQLKLSVFWTRFFLVIAGFIQPVLTVAFYVIAMMVMPSEKKMSKSKPYIPPIPKPMGFSNVNREQLEAQYDQIESRIQELENLVTSKEYLLLKKFEELS